VVTPTSESRAKILDVAEALFARRGYAGVGMREVAAGVGLGKSSLFHHFATKLELYDEVLGRALARIAEAVEPVLRSPGDPVAKLEQLIDALVDGLAEHPTTSRLALRSLFEEDEIGYDPENPPPYEAILERVIGAFQRLIGQGVAAGVFRPVSPGHLTQTLIGATVYHFASSDLGEEILGAPIFSADQVRERKRELKALIRGGIVSQPSARNPGPWSPRASNASGEAPR
jgi:TetR/AcrR family transcriptional regulator